MIRLRRCIFGISLVAIVLLLLATYVSHRRFVGAGQIVGNRLVAVAFFRGQLIINETHLTPSLMPQIAPWQFRVRSTDPAAGELLVDRWFTDFGVTGGTHRLVVFAKTTPNSQFFLSVPIGVLAIPFALIALRDVWLMRRGQMRRLTGRCMTCGYDLRTHTGQCPECGAVVVARVAENTVTK